MNHGVYLSDWAICFVLCKVFFAFVMDWELMGENLRMVSEDGYFVNLNLFISFKYHLFSLAEIVHRFETKSIEFLVFHCKFETKIHKNFPIKIS